MIAKLDSASTIDGNAEHAKRAILKEEKMARTRFQHGSLFQRGKRQRVWVARWYEQVIRADGSLGGLRRSVVLGKVSDLCKKDAKNKLASLLKPINTGGLRPQSTRSLREFALEDWEPVVLPTLKYSTQRHYKYLLKVHVLPGLGGCTLHNISREQIQSFLAAKLKSQLSWKTVRHIRTLLVRLLNCGVKWGYVGDNVAGKTELPKREPKAPKSILSPDHIRKLVGALREPCRSIVVLLTSTGLRIGELLALHWRNVDLARAEIHIRETVYDGFFGEPKTRRSVRPIPLGPEAVGILSVLRPNGVEPDRLVFSTREGKPLDRRNLLRRELKPVCRALNLPEITWHDLRHCHATYLDTVGAGIGTIQAQLGHSSAEVTRYIYVHTVPAEHRRAVEAVERLVFGPKWTQIAAPRENKTCLVN